MSMYAAGGRSVSLSMVEEIVLEAVELLVPTLIGGMESNESKDRGLAAPTSGGQPYTIKRLKIGT